MRDLPIIDYHCHLNENEIRDDIGFESLGALWLGGDHYKWRAMRLCGVDEHFITGDATDYEKYRKYAEIFPRLCGNPLYNCGCLRAQGEFLGTARHGQRKAGNGG